MTRFDALKKDAGYAAAIETKPESMLSSHAVKRFFRSFFVWRIWLFRRLLQRLFLWRLSLERPRVIELGLDTMVMDNDEARRREGVTPTYKRVKGFQPLQVTWGRLIVDAVFRGGDKHSNHGDTAVKTLTHLVGRIRKAYDPLVPIVVRLDAGFFDQTDLSDSMKCLNSIMVEDESGRKKKKAKRFTASNALTANSHGFSRCPKTWMRITSKPHSRTAC